MKEIIHVQSSQVLAVEFGDVAMNRISGCSNFFDVIADVLTGNIIQFVGRQIEIAAEIRIHINLQATGRLEVFEIVLTTCQHDLCILTTGNLTTLSELRTNLVFLTRQHEEFALAVILLCSSEHEVIIKTEYIVSDNDVGTLRLDELRPLQ